MKNQIERWLILPFSLGCASRSSIQAKSPLKMFKFRKPSFARGFRRLIQSLRSASQIFSYRDEESESESESEAEIEIGFPTDVKHLLHIGRDGSTITNPCKSLTEPEMVSCPPVSMKQFEAAMAAQAKQPVTQNHTLLQK